MHSPLSSADTRTDLVHDLFLPTLLFVALGGMTWAVRGCSGYGATAGCIFAGVMWGTAWWFIAREDGGEPRRRYTSGWIVLAVTVGMGISGARGWMQWPSFFEGKIQTNTSAGESLPISRIYGFLWLFIAGVPWAGIAACMLAWCGSLRTTRAWHWLLRIGFGLGGAWLAGYLYQTYPEHFLPLYDSLADRYNDFEHNPNLRRLVNDSRLAIIHLGLYGGFLLYEIVRRDWKNTLLILTVGLVNGVGWALWQNWKWAANVWPEGRFNWWRCWESSGGLSIGLAFGLAYFLVNRPMSNRELALVRARRSISGPNLEWLAVYLGLTALLGLPVLTEVSPWGLALLASVAAFGVYYFASRHESYAREPAPPSDAYGDANLEQFGLYLGLLLGLGLSIRNGIKGWFNIYYGNEDYWSAVLWWIFGPAMLAILIAFSYYILARPLARDFQNDRFPRAYALIWLVLVVQNILAQLITGPLDQWNEFAFSIYYVLLFFITAVIVIHYHEIARCRRLASQ